MSEKVKFEQRDTLKENQKEILDLGNISLTIC